MRSHRTGRRVSDRSAATCKVGTVNLTTDNQIFLACSATLQLLKNFIYVVIYSRFPLCMPVALSDHERHHQEIQSVWLLPKI